MNSADNTAPVVSLERVSVTYESGPPWARVSHPAVNGVSLAIRPGETVGLVGESGSGKTTIGKLVLGLLRADDGRRPLRRRTTRPSTETKRRHPAGVAAPGVGAQPVPQDRNVDRRATGRRRRQHSSEQTVQSRRNARDGGHRGVDGVAVPARAVRRPTSARSDRTSADLTPTPGRLRRSRECSGRVRTGTGAQPHQGDPTRTAVTQRCSSRTISPRCATSPTASSSCTWARS